MLAFVCFPDLLLSRKIFPLSKLCTLVSRQASTAAASENSIINMENGAIKSDVDRLSHTKQLLLFCIVYIINLVSALNSDCGYS